jgi:hypothetical protein
MLLEAQIPRKSMSDAASCSDEMLLEAQIPRKGMSDAASCLDEMLLDDEESWSDFTYASCVAESDIVEDGGTINERIPFVEFLDCGLDGNVECGGMDVARLPVHGSSGPDENVECGGMDVARLPVHGSRNGGDHRFSQDWVATRDVDESSRTWNVRRHPVRDYTAFAGVRKRYREDQWRRDLYGRRVRGTGRELDWRESGRFESRATYFDDSRGDRLNRREGELTWRESERFESRATYYDSSGVDELRWRECGLNWQEASERFQSRTTFYDNNQAGVARDCQHQWRCAPVRSYDQREGFLRAMGPNDLPGTRDSGSARACRSTDVREEWDEETGLWRYFRR